MATLRELKGRIGSVKSSEKITGAMKMISSAKMHKAEGALRRLVPYRNQIQSVIGHLLCSDVEFKSPLVEEREVKTIAFAVFGSDDGLCGAYNMQIFKNMLEEIAAMRKTYGEDVKIKLFPIGKKIVKAVRKMGDPYLEIVKDSNITSRGTLEDVKAFNVRMQDEFVNGTVDKVVVLYTHFKSVSKQYPVTETLLPVSPESLSEEGAEVDTNKPYLFEPGPNQIFNTVLPLYILAVLKQVFGENLASEQAARIMAMQSANDNAKKLLEELQLVYNKLRQQSITTELLDILGGQKRD